MSADARFTCPLPDSALAQIVMAHGGGGRVMHEFLERLILPAFRNSALDARHDGGIIETGTCKLALTTDSYVVSPHEFPGGDIGSLSVHGTINDLAMCGARPLALSAALILEEGFPIERVECFVRSMRDAAHAARVPIVTGDTKVIPRGKGDGLFINTSGVGLIEYPLTIAPSSVRAGDAILVSGDLGRHAIAVMSAREGLAFETTVKSDSAPLWGVVESLMAGGIEIHCLRDLTRGGLAGALVEIAETARISIELDEMAVPVRDDVRGACELLGLDPLHTANEGRFVALIAPGDAARAVSIMRDQSVSADACSIGGVNESRPGFVVARTALGTARLVDMFSGEQLPRIC